MQVLIQPSKIKGKVQAPASKSSMQRACAAALLRKGESIIFNPGNSNDDKAALSVIEGLGASVEKTDNNSIRILSKGIHPVSGKINCGESGLGIRMFTPIAALSREKILIEGEGSLLSRPMDFFDKVLPLLHVKVKSNNGKLPLELQGPLMPDNITIDGSLSSQFLTGLLMAYAAAEAKDVTVKVIDLKSKPYISLTIQVMKQFGLKTPQIKNFEEFYFDSTSVGNQAERVEYTVEGDWSGAAFLLVAGAIGGEIEISGIQNTSCQADKKIIDVLLDAGAEVIVEDEKVFCKRKKLEPFEFNAIDCPDLFPPLVALAAHCKGISRIRGLKRLKHKESDRGLTLKQEFEKLSIQIDLQDDEMIVHGSGGVFIKNHTLNSHHDHRIAMACAVACLQSDFPVVIRNAEAIKKSYPAFFSDLIKLNASIETE